MDQFTYGDGMMKKLALVVVMVVMGASLAMAQTSKENRGNKWVYVGWSPIGIHVPTLFGRPLHAGAILGENIELGGLIGAWEDEDSEGDASYKGKFSDVGGYGKWFMGTNSFYLMAGVNKRSWEVTINVRTDTNNVLVTGTANADSTVATAGIGSQWMFKFGMYINLDYLLVSTAMSETTSVTVSTTGLSGVDLTEAQQEMQKVADALLEFSRWPGAIVLTIGFAF